MGWLAGKWSRLQARSEKETQECQMREEEEQNIGSGRDMSEMVQSEGKDIGLLGLFSLQ